MCDGKRGDIGRGLGSQVDNEGIISEDSESLESLELTRRGIPTEKALYFVKEDGQNYVLQCKEKSTIFSLRCGALTFICHLLKYG